MKRLLPLEPIRLEPLTLLTPVYGKEHEGLDDVDIYERVACEAVGVPYY